MYLPKKPKRIKSYQLTAVLPCFIVLVIGFSTNAQDPAFRMLGPVKTLGMEPSIRFSFAGNEVLKVEYESAQGLFDATTGQTIFRTPSENNLGAGYDPNTGTVFRGNSEGNLAFYKLENEKLVETSQSSAFAVKDMRYSSDGKRILLGDEFLRMFDVESGEILWSYDVEGFTGLLIPEWNEDSGIIEVVEMGLISRIQLLSDDTGELLFEKRNSLTGFPGKVTGAAMSVYSDVFGKSFLIDHTTFTTTHFTHRETEIISEVRILTDKSTIMGTTVNNPYSPTQSRFFIKNLSDDSFVTWIDEARQSEGLTDQVTSFALTEDEGTLLLGTETGRLESWDYGKQRFL